MYLNKIGLYSLFLKEIKRFLKIYNQTIVAPIITNLTFFAVFVLALGNNSDGKYPVNFYEFIATGLIIMSMVQNSFANSSSVIISSKVMGTIGDYLTPPFKPLEIIIGLVGGSILRGFMTGIITFFILSFIVEFHIIHPFLLLFYTIIPCIMLALLGILAGIISNSFDQMGAVTAYLITPFSFLSGTFYVIKKLPAWLHKLTYYNPFFYMIDGFRYSFTNYHDASILSGMTILIIFVLFLSVIINYSLSKGWRIKN